jgi:hypothetical protein
MWVFCTHPARLGAFDELVRLLWRRLSGSAAADPAPQHREAGQREEQHSVPQA